MTSRTLNTTDTDRALSARTNAEPLWLVTDGDMRHPNGLQCQRLPPFRDDDTCDIPHTVTPPADLVALTEPCKTCGGVGYLVVAAHDPRCDGNQCERMCPVQDREQCPDCPKLLTLRGECEWCGGGGIRHPESRPEPCITCDAVGTVDLGEWRVEQVVPIWRDCSTEHIEGEDYPMVTVDFQGEVIYSIGPDEDDGEIIDLGPNPEQHVGRYAYRVVPA